MTQHNDEIIEVLDCDLGARPKAAPGIDALLPHVRAATSTPRTLFVEFDPDVAATLEAFVEAERLCCAGIGWQIERDSGLRLRITAAEAQVTALQLLWKASQIESHQ